MRSQSSFMRSRTNSRRELDRALLEVLPEREVAEHLEEREVVARRGPTSSMSAVRKHLLRQSSSAAPGGGSRPRKNGICGCMPAVDQERRVGRPRAGRATYDGQRRWPCLLEEREEALTQLGGRAHLGILRAMSQAAGRGYAAGGGPVRLRLVPALRSSSSSSLSRRAAASLATRTASPASRRDWNADTPCDTAGSEAADLLHGRRDRGRDRADGRVGAVGHRDGAVGHGVELVELVVHAIDGSARLDDDGQRVALGALDERRQPSERASHADEQVERAPHRSR